MVIGHSQWPTLQKHIQRVVEAVNAATPGSYVEVDVPLPPKEAIHTPMHHLPASHCSGAFRYTDAII